MAGRPPFDQFDAKSEDIEKYLKRLQEYFTAYDIEDDEENAAKRRVILLTSIRSNCFRVLKDLALPDFIRWGPGYESVYYGINNTRPIYSERAHQALQNPQVSC